MTVKTIFITSGTTFTVPLDWNHANNTVFVIGDGGGGSSSVSGTNYGVAGGGGAFSSANNLVLTPGSNVAVHIGSGGAGGSGSEGPGSAGSGAWFNGTSLSNASVSAAGGGGGTPTTQTPGAGGATASGIGSTKFAGGSGGSVVGNGFNGGSGAGGAGGPNGAGAMGGVDSASSGGPGGPGGGANGGTAGGDATTATPLAGGAGASGGGSGGSSGGLTGNGTPGGSGAIWTQTSDSTTAGPGGGAGGAGAEGNNGGAGGLYGGAGSGGGFGSAGTGSSVGGAGGQGLIVVQYSPAIQGMATVTTLVPTASIHIQNRVNTSIAGKTLPPKAAVAANFVRNKATIAANTKVPTSVFTTKRGGHGTIAANTKPPTSVFTTKSKVGATVAAKTLVAKASFSGKVTIRGSIAGKTPPPKTVVFTVHEGESSFIRAIAPRPVGSGQAQHKYGATSAVTTLAPTAAFTGSAQIPLINQAQYQSVLAQIQNVTTLAALQSIAAIQIPLLAAQRDSTQTSLLNLLPQLALAQGPNSPTNIGVWIQGTIQAQIAPIVLKYNSYIVQLDQLATTSAQITAAINEAGEAFGDSAIAVDPLIGFPTDATAGQQFFDIDTNGFVTFDGTEWNPSPAPSGLPYENAEDPFAQAAFDAANTAPTANTIQDIANSVIQPAVSELQELINAGTAGQIVLTQKIANVSVTLSNTITASVLEEAEARAGADEALANTITAVTATFNTQNASVTEQFAAVATTTTAIAGDLTTLSASTAAGLAAVNTNTVVISNAVAAAAGTLTTVQANFANSVSLINSNAAVLSTALSALTVTSTTQTSQIGNNAASISTIANTLVTLGGITDAHLVLSANTTSGGLTLVVLDSNSLGTSIALDAEKIYFGDNVVVTAQGIPSTTYLNSGFQFTTGNGFGASPFLLWYGPENTATDVANAVFYLDTAGNSSLPRAFFQATVPTGNFSAASQWFDFTTGNYYIYSGTAWVLVNSPPVIANTITNTVTVTNTIASGTLLGYSITPGAWSVSIPANSTFNAQVVLVGAGGSGVGYESEIILVGGIPFFEFTQGSGGGGSGQAIGTFSVTPGVTILEGVIGTGGVPVSLNANGIAGTATTLTVGGTMTAGGGHGGVENPGPAGGAGGTASGGTDTTGSSGTALANGIAGVGGASAYSGAVTTAANTIATLGSGGAGFYLEPSAGAGANGVVVVYAV